MHYITFFLLGFLFIFSSCKNPPTFTSDNPYDTGSGTYLMSDIQIEDFDPYIGYDEIIIDWRYPDEFLSEINVYKISPNDSTKTLLVSSDDILSGDGFKFGTLSIPYFFDYKLTLQFEVLYFNNGEKFSGSVINDFNHTFNNNGLIDIADDTASFSFVYLDYEEGVFSSRGVINYRLIDLTEDRIISGGRNNYFDNSVLINGNTFMELKFFSRELLTADHEYVWQFYQVYDSRNYNSSLIELTPFEN